MESRETPPNTLPDGTGRQRETDQQVGRQTGDIYVGRISGQTKKGVKNKTRKGRRGQKQWRFTETET